MILQILIEATQRTRECMGGILGKVPNAESKPVLRISVKSMSVEEYLKCFLFPNSSQTVFKRRYFGRQLPLEMGFQD